MQPSLKTKQEFVRAEHDNLARERFERLPEENRFRRLCFGERKWKTIKEEDRRDEASRNHNFVAAIPILSREKCASVFGKPEEGAERETGNQHANSHRPGY